MCRNAPMIMLTLASALAATWAMAAGGAGEAPPDPIMGRFEGTFTPQGGSAIRAEASVIADENGKYRIVILHPAGNAKATRIELSGTRQRDEVEIASKDWQGSSLAENWAGKVTKTALSIHADSPKGGKAEMKRANRRSPTLGQKPPAEAIVLLPFEEGKPTTMDQWSNAKWTCEPDGSMKVGRGDTKTNRDFGSFTLHMEFRVPFMPAARGQGRGNSGLYLHGRYEVQVLDSFGLTMNPGECGGLYGFKPPDINASLPPGQWQTFDIDFRAPQIDAKGQQTKGAVVRVLLNGVKIHDAVEVKAVSGGAWGAPGRTGPLRLQDHGNPMRFRNIWLVERK